MSDYEEIEKCIFSNKFAESATFDVLPIGCGCNASCDDEEICFCIAQNPCQYNSDRCLKDLYCEDPVYECNENCECPKNCINRLVQYNSIWKFNICQTYGKGKGLKCVENIPKGAFVIEYIGEIITQEEATERIHRLSKEESCYLVKVKEYSSSVELYHYVDATRKGNNARFINHSCDPNLIMVPVRSKYTFPHLALFSKMDIASGEELTFDYGKDSVFVKENDNETMQRKKCYCNSNSCRGSLPYDSAAFP